MVEAHQLDGILLLGSCDKIGPGMLMAAARLNLTVIFLPGGPMEGGREFDGRKTDATSVYEAYGMLSAGKITPEESLRQHGWRCGNPRQSCPRARAATPTSLTSFLPKHTSQRQVSL